MKLIPCKHLDHNPDNYPSCELKTAEPHCPGVKFFERKEAPAGAPTRVQFCGAGRGRINAVFDCYDGSMHCYDPADPETVAPQSRQDEG